MPSTLQSREERQPLLHASDGIFPARLDNHDTTDVSSQARLCPRGQTDTKKTFDPNVKPDGRRGENNTAVMSSRKPPYVASLNLKEREAAETALVRKIDIRLVPPITLMYILNYLNRNAIASARLGGLEDDLNLKGSEYQTSVSIFFVGYILMQVPSNLLMNKLGKPSLYLCIAMMVWGAISALTAAVHNFAGLVTVRFILGFVESPFFPGALFLLSCFYTRRELALRIALLYSGSLISCAFAGLIAGGIVKGMEGLGGISAWRWLFIVEGVATIFIAFAAIFILPDMPMTTKWLTAEQRELAAWRLYEDIGQDNWTGSKDQSFFSGFMLAIKDTKVWVMTVLVFCMALSGSVNNFFPTIVQTLGFGRIESLLLTAPPYALGAIACIINAWHSDRTGEKSFHVILPLCFGVASFVLAAATVSTVSRYLSMLLMILGCFMGYAVALGWISSTIPRPPAKLAAAQAFINAVSNTASIFASYLFPSSAAPRYVVAFVVFSCSSFVAICAVSMLRVMLGRLNKKLERGEFVEGVAVRREESVPEEAAGRRFSFLM